LQRWKGFDRETSLSFSTSPEVSLEQQERWFGGVHGEFGVPIGDHDVEFV
jgi:hypothetical protein